MTETKAPARVSLRALRLPLRSLRLRGESFVPADAGLLYLNHTDSAPLPGARRSGRGTYFFLLPKTGSGCGIAAPSLRGDEAPYFIPVAESYITACPPPMIVLAKAPRTWST
jgi:hypothetical protein